MHERKTLGRREFTAASALAALSGVAITISGCGGGSSGGGPTTPSTPAPTPTPDSGDVSGTVSANHGHTAVIGAARLAAPEAVELDITGGSDHPHTVELSADEVQQIADGQQVSKPSSVDQGHSHTVTFN
jgi:hypothetical protein